MISAASISSRRARPATCCSSPGAAAACRRRYTSPGIGLPEENRDRLTDPYVTTRAKGTGLGLAIVRKIVEQHGGELILANATEPDEQTGLDGARVTVRLPMPSHARNAEGAKQTTEGEAA